MLCSLLIQRRGSITGAESLGSCCFHNLCSWLEAVWTSAAPSGSGFTPETSQPSQKSHVCSCCVITSGSEGFQAPEASRISHANAKALQEERSQSYISVSMLVNRAVAPLPVVGGATDAGVQVGLARSRHSRLASTWFYIPHNSMLLEACWFLVTSPQVLRSWVQSGHFKRHQMVSHRLLIHPQTLVTVPSFCSHMDVQNREAGLVLSTG